MLAIFPLGFPNPCVVLALLRCPVFLGRRMSSSWTLAHPFTSNGCPLPGCLCSPTTYHCLCLCAVWLSKTCVHRIPHIAGLQLHIDRAAILTDKIPGRQCIWLSLYKVSDVLLWKPVLNVFCLTSATARPAASS